MHGVPTATLQGASGELPVKANELLLWLSAVKAGTWNQFRGAVESLHLPDDAPEQHEENQDHDYGDAGQDRTALPVYQQLRLNLQRLAHAEFFARGCEGGWRIAPPVLAIREDETVGWTGILCGARSPSLAARLQEASIGNAAVHAEELDGAPTLYRFEAKRAFLTRLAAQARLHLQADAPLAIMGCLPPLSHRALPAPGSLPVGRDWKFERFSAHNLNWTEASREEAISTSEGLFRCRFRQQWLYFLCIRGAAYEMRQGQIGKYYLLARRRRRVLRYDPLARMLSMPASCRPPLLLERSLILFTGKLPSFDAQNTTLTYAGIPPLAARSAARLLGQEASL
jgi:hypothetical protein